MHLVRHQEEAVSELCRCTSPPFHSQHSASTTIQPHKPTLAISSPALAMLHLSARLSCLARVIVTFGGMEASAGCLSSSWAAAGDGTSKSAARDSNRALYAGIEC